MPHPNPLVGLDEASRAIIVRGLPEDHARVLATDFSFTAHGGQLAPPGDWRTWAIVAGRGFGKTRSGAEWVLGVVRPSTGSGCAGKKRKPPLPARAKRRESPSPARGEGQTKGRSVQAGVFPLPARLGGESPSPGTGEGIRVALVAATIDEARRIMVEGPSGILACARPGEIAGWSFERRTLTFASGAQAFLYSGTSPEALRGPEHDFAWCDELAKWRHAQATWDNLSLGLRRGAWPQALVTTTPRSCAMLAAILAAPDTVRTGGSSHENPFLSAGFAARQAALLAGTRRGREEIDGEMIADVEGSLWPLALIERCRAGRACATLPVRSVHASRGKAARAEPVAALFEAGRAGFAGVFPALEAELSGLTVAGGYQGLGASPDRADAMVWALWELMLAPRAGVPRIITP